MQRIVQQTNGVFIPNAQPHNIVERLLSLLDSVNVTVPEKPSSVTFRNLATGETRNASFTKASSGANTWAIALPSYGLQFGINSFEITTTLLGGTSKLDTLRIERVNQTVQGPIGSFVRDCSIDTFHLDVTGTPDEVETTQGIAVTAKVRDEEKNRFAPDDITLRAFTRFDNDAATLALYHLEGNLNDSAGSNHGTGAPQFSSEEYAFGEQSLNAGQSFSITAPPGLSGDFTLEMWAKPANSGELKLVGGSGLNFGINTAGHLYLGTWTSAHRVDRNVWQHIALTRSAGVVKVYVNGLEIGSPTSATVAMVGALSIGPANGFIDEIRISNTVRTETVSGVPMLRIPTTSLRWTVDGSTTTGATATLPGTRWTAAPMGQTNFQIGADEHTQVILNLLHPTTGSVWSKVSNPLLIYKKYAMLVIESDPTGQQSPTRPNPIDTLFITALETQKSAYAVIRDSRGHFVEASQTTNWTSANTAWVTVAPGDQSRGEGVFTKKADDQFTTVTATNPTHTLTGTVPVRVLGYYWKELQIVTGPANTPIDHLAMTTDQDTVLKVRGLRSDNDQWEDANGDWGVIPITPPTQTLSGPNGAFRWEISLASTDTGTGYIKVTGGDPAMTKPDSISYDFSPAGPSNIEIEMITPEAGRIAGDTLTAVVRIKNLDGLVPGTYCDTTIYSDNLGTGGRIPPIVVVDDGETGLNTNDGMGNKTGQCFDGGIDTVKFVLYYAPFDKDSLHQLKVRLGSLQGAVPPFELLPGPLARIEIEDANGQALGPQTLHHPDGTVMMYASGYDRFGNKRGPESGDWVFTDGLPGIKNPDSVSQVYYEVMTARDDATGYAVVSANVNAQIKDSVLINVIGPRAKLLSAVTKDENGNGYLDAVVLTFDGEVSIPADFEAFNGIILTHKQSVMRVDSISGRGTQGIVFTVYLDEPEEGSGAAPQTDWTPRLTIRNLELAEEVSDRLTTDGAGPVVWSVVKYAHQDRTREKVVVTLSEEIGETDGDEFSTTNPPGLVFNVWVDTAAIDSFMLDSIPRFAEKQGKTLVFYMINGRELTGEHYFNLRQGLVADKGEVNSPVENNRKVRVEVRGAIGDLVVGPNPLTPTFFIPSNERGERGVQRELRSHSAVEVYEWIKDPSKGGAAIKVTRFVMSGKDGVCLPDPAQGALLVFDAIGNLVHQRTEEDIIPPEWRENCVPGREMELNFYWNGITDRNTRAAPGIYKVMVSIRYQGQEQVFRTNVGIGR
jgi:hypothetical protein